MCLCVWLLLTLATTLSLNPKSSSSLRLIIGKLSIKAPAPDACTKRGSLNFKMIGYSKFRNRGTPRSSSMDLSYLSTFSEPAKLKAVPPLIFQETNQTKSPSSPKNTDTAHEDYSLAMPEEDQESNDERFNIGKLKRNSSVCFSASEVLQFSVRRAFSMRRSSSVSERYCRILDQPVTVASPVHDGEDNVFDTVETTRSAKKKHTNGRILKACAIAVNLDVFACNIEPTLNGPRGELLPIQEEGRQHSLNHRGH